MVVKIKTVFWNIFPFLFGKMNWGMLILTSTWFWLKLLAQVLTNLFGGWRDSSENKDCFFLLFEMHFRFYLERGIKVCCYLLILLDESFSHGVKKVKYRYYQLIILILQTFLFVIKKKKKQSFIFFASVI